MIRTRTLCQNEACLIAVAALDEMVTALVSARFLQVAPAFFDWVADEATPLVEQQVADAFSHPVFAASLRQGDHRLVLAAWMRHWVRPGLAARFADLLPYLPPADSRLPVLLPVTVPVTVTVPVSAAPRVPAALPLPAARPHHARGLAVPA